MNPKNGCSNAIAEVILIDDFRFVAQGRFCNISFHAKSAKVEFTKAANSRMVSREYRPL